MMQLYLIRLASLIIIALVYMLYDVFNKRNVPSVFAYATLIYGAILTLLYFDLSLILISSGIALVILGVGYCTYRIGQLGAADVIEFAALSLVMPIQINPILISALSQLGAPLILSLLIDTGIVAILIIPIYYLPKAIKKMKRPLSSNIGKGNVFLAMLIAVVYLAFMDFVVIAVGPNYIGITIIALMLVSSFLLVLFSTPLTYAMIDYIAVASLEEGDIIATNVMRRSEIKSVKSKFRHFDRLVTNELIREIRAKDPKRKFPVYRKAMPFALPIFIGLILSLLVGNLLFLVLRI